MSAKWIAIVVVVVIVVGAVAGFAAYNMGMQAGMQRAQAIRAQFLADRGLSGNGAGGGFGGQGGQGGQGGANRQFNPNNFAAGQVKTVNGNTVELSTATEVLKVQLTDQTQIQKTGAGTISDIQAGERLTVQGTRAADGTFTAQSIQIGGNRFGGQGGQGGAGGQGAGGGSQGGTGGQGAGGGGRSGRGGQGGAPASEAGTPQAQSSQ